MDYRDINGIRFSLSSATIEVDGFEFFGAQGLKVDESLEPGEVPGNSSVARGHTKGKWSGTGSLNLPLGEWGAFLGALGSNYGARVWTATWVWMELEGDGILTVKINGARITKFSIDGGDAQKPSTTTFDFLLTKPSSVNGATIVDSGEDFLSSFGSLFSL